MHFFLHSLAMQTWSWQSMEEIVIVVCVGGEGKGGGNRKMHPSMSVSTFAHTQFGYRANNNPKKWQPATVRSFRAVSTGYGIPKEKSVLSCRQQQRCTDRWNEWNESNAECTFSASVTGTTTHSGRTLYNC